MSPTHLYGAVEFASGTLAEKFISHPLINFPFTHTFRTFTKDATQFGSGACQHC